jgi:hypothetical protein
VKSCVLRSKKHAGLEAVKALAPPQPIPCCSERYTFYVWRLGGSGANNSTPKARPHSKNVAAPNSGHAKSPLQVCDDLLRQIPRNSVFAAGASSRPRSGLSILCGQKMSHAADRRPRAAQGMATTSCGKLLRDRGQRGQKISCRFSLMAARLAAQQIETAGAGLAIDYCGLR